ncbi:MAG: acyl-CoA dehydrogenase family protein [Bacteriovoracaceae bacterium]|nr:acyl-CoA dehydrogenase family protein [Bacteriovoracaceae bacterium]
MDFELTEEQKLLRSTVRSFAEEEIRPTMKEFDKKEEFPVEITKKMFDLGLFGIFVPEEYGGSGLDYLSYVIVVEELARVNASCAATVAAGNSLGIGPIYYFGTKEQKQKYLPPLCSDKKLWGFGLTEPDAGSDASNTKTTGLIKDERIILNGAKIFITNASSPLTLGSTVQFKSGVKDNGKKELSCALVLNNTDGFTQKTMKNKMVWRSSNTAELYFQDCTVPQENLLGKKGDGLKIMLSTLDRGRLSIAAMGLGGAQGAYEAALRYSKQRVQFGVPISTMPVNAFKLAEMATRIEAARSLLYRTCWELDNNKPFAEHAAMSKLYCADVMRYCANEGVQLHGGYGLMEEFDAAMFFRDQKLLDIGEGTSEIQRMVISRHIGCYDLAGGA